MKCRNNEVPDNVALCPIAFASKILSSMQWQYSNVERKALGILHGLKKLQHYSFARKVHIITDHKPLVAIFSKDVATLALQLK